MGLLTFKGGVHPNDGKSLAKDKAIVELLPQGDLVYPLSQHIGAPAKPVVAKGDHVLKGQKIAEAGGFVSAPIYASVSGTVKAIEPRVNPTGSKVNSIIIANDGQYEEVEYPQPKPLSELTKEEILNIIGEAGVVGMGECADPKECKAIADLGIDFLAAGIGNIHGKYPANWQGLNFEVLENVKKEVGDMPLVLHGGTGIPADMIKKAISLGVAKINVNTECQLAFAAATRKYIEEGKDEQGKGYDPRKLLAPGFEAIKATVKEKMELFGSVDKA